MNTEILNPSKETYEKCALVIKEGGLVAFPTETVYGLGANALNGAAVKKIYEAKGRPQDNPIIVHVAERGEISDYAEISQIAKKLMEAFMPGPITLVLKRSGRICPEVSYGLDTVGIRIPLNPIARDFIKECRLPIAAPSANSSTRPSPTEAAHVLEDLGGKIPYIIDGGRCQIGIESTVVDATGNTPVILRLGKITPGMIRSVCGDVRISFEQPDKPASPGTKYIHYTPACECALIDSHEPKFIEQVVRAEVEKGRKVSLLCFSQFKMEGASVYLLGNDNFEAASNLFYLLRLAEKNSDIIFIEAAMGRGEFADSLLNRMIKSAGGNVITEP